MWHYLYKVSDGALQTETDDDVVLANIPVGYAIRSRATRWLQTADRWDEATKDFLARDLTPNADQALRLLLLSKPAATWTLLENSQCLRLMLLRMGPL